MANEYPCEKRGEQIIALFEKVKEIGERLNCVEKRDRTDDIERAQLKTLVDFIIEDGNKRADRDDKINTAINSLNENIVILNHDMKDVKLDIQKINERVEKDQALNRIDLREIQKDTLTNKLKKGLIIGGCFVGGTGTLASIIYGIIKIIEKFLEA